MATASRILLCSNSENRTGPRRKVSWLSLPLKPNGTWVVLVVHRCAGIDPDIEGLANRKQERDRVRHLQRGDVLAVHLQYAGAALCDAGAVIREIEHDGVIARSERLLAFCSGAARASEVVVEHRLAVEQDATPAIDPAPGDEHSFAAPSWSGSETRA
jgi:hypothetical protein